MDVRAAPSTMPIPDRLNVGLVIGVVAAAIGLLWWASTLENMFAVFGVGILFSYLLLTNYALLHEAAHNNLHSDRRMNRLLGTMTGILFPLPFSMIRTMHQGHHLRNRTDFEMFDLYYPDDSRLVRVVQWYGILLGLFWPWAPIGAVLFAICPGLLHTKPFRQARSSSYLLGDIRATEVRAIRVEVLLTILFFAALVWFLHVRWQSTLVLYACFAVNWSTRQYIAHAFTKRDVVEGAWNLRHNRLMSWILLHGEYDLNHHRHPELSWYYLPRIESDAPRLSYIRQYWRLWRGPRLATESGPEALAEIPLSVHS